MTPGQIAVSTGWTRQIGHGMANAHPGFGEGTGQEQMGTVLERISCRAPIMVTRLGRSYYVAHNKQLAHMQCTTSTLLTHSLFLFQHHLPGPPRRSWPSPLRSSRKDPLQREVCARLADPSVLEVL